MKIPLAVPGVLGTGRCLSNRAGLFLGLAASWPFLLLAVEAFAAVPAAEGDLPAGGAGEASLKMLGSLLLVLGLILFVYYLMKRFRLAPFQSGGDSRMRLLGTLPLAPKRLVALVEVCGEWLVLGIGNESISLLSKIDKPASTEGLTGPGPSEAPSFEGVLRRRLFGSLGQRKGKGREGV